VQYICLDGDSLQWLVRPGPIEIPPLAERQGDLPRIVDEYVLDATVALSPALRSLVFPEGDREWLGRVGETFRCSPTRHAQHDQEHRRPTARPYPLADANQALDDLRAGRHEGAMVLIVRRRRMTR
jgi:hypothetical protein